MKAYVKWALFVIALKLNSISAHDLNNQRSFMPIYRKRDSPHIFQNHLIKVGDDSNDSFSRILKQKTSSLTKIQAVLSSRGGACDSDPILFAKVGLGAMFETFTLLLVLAGAVSFTKKFSSDLSIPKIQDVSLPIWIILFLMIFASSFFGSIIDGGLSAASSQVLEPNVTPGEPDWYANLKRPSWEPPGWVFPIMWLIISKPTQLYAVITLLKKENKVPWPALAIYCSHLSLGDAWNKVFFGLQCPGRGAAVISVFWAVLVLSAILFYNIDETAGKYMLPSCAWVTVASALNWNIYLNNK